VTAGPTAAVQHPCDGCGAGLQYAPGTTALRCPYCGSQQAFSTPAVPAQQRWSWAGGPPPTRVAELPDFSFTCPGCGATATTPELAGPCPYCTAPTVHDDSLGGRLHSPDAVVPCALDKRAATDAFRAWVSSRWFAPNALKKVAATETLHGTYVPHWTYDATTTSSYTGQRGDYYWVTVTDTVLVDGKPQTRTRQERRTRWSSASGTVARGFVDVLTPASTALPRESLDELCPWELAAAQPYTPQFLSGFTSPRYDVDVDTGFLDAQRQMASVIEDDCRRDIGGDEQRVHSVDTRYDDVAFRQVLLPVWLGSYLLHGRTFTVLVNASTGECLGDRPYSKAKIALAVLAGLLLAGAAYLLWVLYGSGDAATLTPGAAGLGLLGRRHLGAVTSMVPSATAPTCRPVPSQPPSVGPVAVTWTRPMRARPRSQTTARRSSCCETSGQRTGSRGPRAVASTSTDQPSPLALLRPAARPRAKSATVLGSAQCARPPCTDGSESTAMNGTCTTGSTVPRSSCPAKTSR
jgi:hypothetical protein